MNFIETEVYLLSLGNEVETMKLGLENIRTLLDALGNPQNKYLKVQVAGTNGKGSVCAFLNSICVHAGIRTGLYTSPHLVSITERIKIDGVDISEDEFAGIASLVRETSELLVEGGQLETVPTYFEQVTAIALVAFANHGAELAILETGLGGRLDATTAANAEIAVITQIDLDHQEYLGDTLADIAAEKAAIIRADSRVIVGEQKPTTMEVITSVCANFGVSPRLAQQVSTTCGSGWLKFQTNKTTYSITQLGLLGRHQIENAEVAILAAEVLSRDFNISKDDIVYGLKDARHPGRLEYVGQFLFDGAHNIAGARALRDYLGEFVHQPITMVFGAMREKNIAEMAEILWPKAEHIILTSPDNSRAMTAEELIACSSALIDPGKIIRTDSVAESLDKAKEISVEHSIILVTGSLYLVGETKSILGYRK